jgi:hypothetical protein
MIEKLKGFTQYIAKAIMAAVGPLLVEVIDNLVIEFGTIVQAAGSALVAAVLVYFVPNGPKP